jgi:hypothetical protein
VYPDKAPPVRHLLAPVVEPLMGDRRDLSGEVRLDSRLALSVPEAARALGVSERLLRDVLPEIPHLHIGRRMLIVAEAIIADIRGDRK